MAGLADIFGLGGGSMFGGSGGLYGDMLTPEQKQALAFRGLMSAAGAFGQAAMPSRMPVPIGAVLGSGAAAMAQGQDEGALAALRAALVGQQGAALKQKQTISDALIKDLTGGDTASGFPAAAAAPSTMAPVPSGGAVSSATGGRGGWGPLAAPAVEALSGSGLSTAAVHGVMANGLGEGGFTEPWRKAGGGENSFGHWQFNQGGELPGYLAWAQGKGDPQDTRLQAQFVAKRMEDLVPGFSRIEDPKLATDLVATKFERYKGAAPGQRYGYLADVQKALSGGSAEARPLIPPAPGQLAEGALPPLPDFTGMMVSGRPGAAYAPAALPAPDTAVAGRPAAPVRLTSADVVLRDNGPKTQKLADGTLVSEDAYPYPYSGGVSTAARPPALLAQAPGPAAPAAPPQMFGTMAPGGAVDPMQQRLLALARRNALADLAGFGNPYSSMIGVLQGSPQYQALQEWAKNAPLTARAYAGPDADVRLQGLLAGEKERQTAAASYGRPEFDRELQRALGLDKAAATAGGVIGPQGFAMVPNYSEALAGAAGQKATAEQNARVAAEQQMARFNLDPNAIGSTSPAAAPATAAPAAPATPASPSSGPGYTEPLPTARGTVIPPITEAAPIVGSPKYLEQRQAGKGGWAETEADWAASRSPAKKAEEAALVVADVLKTYQSGAFAGQLSDIRAKLRAVGIDLPESLAGDPAAAQKIVKQNFSQTISSMKGFDSNPAAYQIKLAFENWANTNLQPEANLAILAQSVGLARWQEKLTQDFSEAKKLGWRDPQDFMLKWDQQPANSLKSFVDRATQEIGPLKGAPGTPPQGTTTEYFYDSKTKTIVPITPIQPR